MIYTANYHLPQWVEEDRILMEDFNDAMAGIDQGLQGAKAAADTAESKADAAQSTADNAYCPENKPYVLGTYTGEKSYKEINLGFQPSLVIVCGDSGSNDEMLWQYSAIIYPNYSAANAGITSNGFGVGDAGYFPNLSEHYRTYHYIAFK